MIRSIAIIDRDPFAVEHKREKILTIRHYHCHSPLEFEASGKYFALIKLF